jgi:uncharacterized protein (TIGR00297 family)
VFDPAQIPFWTENGLLVHRLGIGGIITLGFTVLAHWTRGVTLSGAIAGAVMCFALFAGAGPSAFAALLSVFALAWMTTRLGYKRKQKLGTAEQREGRTASQVLANLGVAAACACLYPVSGGKMIFLLALATALSEAAADTVSSEVGQAVSDGARLITTWERVPAGTNGGVSWAGSLAGMAAAAVVSLICVFTRLLAWKLLWISLLASIFGMLADSYLGAWLEGRGLLRNDSVNFLSTLVASITAGVLLSFA